MLYFLYGTDVDARNKEKDLLCGGRVPRRMAASEWSASVVDEYAQSVELFGDAIIVVIDGMCETEEGRDAFLLKAKDMATSANSFIVLEKKATKDFLKKIEKVGGTAKLFEEKTKAPKKEFPIVFSITDAFCARDKKTAWVKLTEAYDAGVSPEEVAGTLFWAIKSMMLARGANSAAEADLSPYVFQKSKRAADSFSVAELRTLSTMIVSLYHDAHGGIVDFKTSLERFILGSL